MKRRDIVIGIVVLVLVGAFVNFRNKKISSEVNKVSDIQRVEQNIEDKFKIEIPEDLDKAELKDVQGNGNSGIATKNMKNGLFSATVLADLPDPDRGMYYQAWISKGNRDTEDYKLFSLGKLVVAKGGWMINFESKTDYSSFDTLIVTMEKVLDNTPEKIMLQGSFYNL